MMYRIQASVFSVFTCGTQANTVKGKHEHSIRSQSILIRYKYIVQAECDAKGQILSDAMQSI